MTSGLRRGEMKSSFFQDVSHCILLVSYRRFGTIYWSHLQGVKESKKCGYELEDRLFNAFVSITYVVKRPNIYPVTFLVQRLLS